MRYAMKQKVFSLGDKFAIQDESGADAFYVDGRAFSLGKQLSFEDAQGRELAFIKQKVLSMAPTYEIFRGGEHFATVQKELFTFLHCTFRIEVEDLRDLEAHGNLSDHEYEFTRNSTPVATVSKQWFTWGDTYGVEIADGKDAILILASTVVIDMCCHDGRRG